MWKKVRLQYLGGTEIVLFFSGQPLVFSLTVRHNVLNCIVAETDDKEEMQ